VAVTKGAIDVRYFSFALYWDAYLCLAAGQIRLRAFFKKG
jgi:hypothetical protein